MSPMELISGNKVVTAVAVGAAVVVGYCLYFDKKRRSDPLFKEKLKESKYIIHSFSYYFGRYPIGRVFCHFNYINYIRG